MGGGAGAWPGGGHCGGGVSLSLGPSRRPRPPRPRCGGRAAACAPARAPGAAHPGPVRVPLSAPAPSRLPAGRARAAGGRAARHDLRAPPPAVGGVSARPRWPGHARVAASHRRPRPTPPLPAARPPPLFPGRTCQDPVSWSSRCAEMPGTRQVPHPQAREPRSSWFAHATRRRHGSQNLRRCTPSLSSSTPAGRAGAGRRTQNSPSVWGLGGDAGWIGGGALAGVWGIFPGSDVCSLLCTGEASGPGGLLRGVGGFPTQGPGLVLSAALQCLWPGGAAAAPDLLSPHSATAHPDPCTLHPGVTSGRPEGRPLQGWAGPASFQIRKRRHISLLLSQAPGSPFLLGKQGRGGRRRPSGAQKGGVSRCPVLPCTGALLQFAPSPLGLARLAVGGGSWRKGSGPQGCCRPGQVGHVRAEPV